MKTILTASLLALLLVAVTPAIVWAERSCCDATCASVFTVLNKATKEPIPGYEVSLTHDCTGQRLSNTTDKMGRVKFPVCAPDISDVTARVPDVAHDDESCRGAQVTIEVVVSDWLTSPGP